MRFQQLGLPGIQDSQYKDIISNISLPEVSYPAYKIERPVPVKMQLSNFSFYETLCLPEGDESVLAEQNRLRPHSRLGELGKHNTGHTSLQTF